VYRGNCVKVYSLILYWHACIIINCSSLPGQSEPDVNITVSSTTIPELGNLSIFCNAINVSTPLLPVKITIRVGSFEIAACDAPGIDPVFQCSFNLQTYFPLLSRTVSCTAEDAEGRCRFKTANITLLQGLLTSSCNINIYIADAIKVVLPKP
jgi:hypothetical protein